jgi:hypothetical protein
MHFHFMKAIHPETFWERFPRGSEGFSHFVIVKDSLSATPCEASWIKLPPHRGVLHKNGLIHPDLLFDMWFINGFYGPMYPIIAHWRAQGDIHVAENFERLAAAGLEWIRKHKGAEYVPQVPYASHER